MQNNYNNIDQLIADKANAFQADKSMMQADFATIQNALPKGPAATTAIPKAKPSWFSLNNILWIVAGTVVLGTVLKFATGKKNSLPKQNIPVAAATTSTPNNDTTKQKITDTDTPVIVYEIPKDPSKAPSKWIYRMKIDFNGKTNKKLPPKTYIPTELSANATKFEEGAIYSSLEKAPEIFKIDGSKDQFIQTKKGNSYFIQAGSFENIYGEPITDEILLEVNEYYKISHIIADKLNTHFNNSYIETEGIIYLQAYNSSNTVKQTTLKPIQAILKTKESKKDVQLFNITNKGWLPNGQFQNEELNSNLKNVVNKSGYYFFNLFQLNWINIGRATTAETNDVTVAINGSSDAIEAHLILADKKICAGVVTNNNEILFKNLPVNQEGTLLVLSKNDSKYEAFIFNINTNNTKETIALKKPLTFAQVKAKLDALGSVQ